MRGYDVIVGNSAKERDSVALMSLTVVVPVIPPTIEIQPVSQSVNVGQSVTFTALASGTRPLSYQWQYNGLNLAGETGTNLTMNFVTTNNAGNYDVIVGNSAGSVTSAVVSLTVVVPVVPPAIEIQPVSQAVNVGQSASFFVVARGTGPLGYQWRFGGLDLAGETGTNLTMNSVTTNSAGNYDVIVGNSAGSVTSAVVSLTVVVPVVPPVIVIEPVSQSVIVGQSVTFTSLASGTRPLSYQWQYNRLNLAGETGTNLTMNFVTTNSAGNYDVIVGNSAGSVTSAVVNLTVVVPVVPPAIEIQPVSQAVNVGQNVTFTVLASGTPPLSYQWRFNNVIRLGEAGTNFTINPVTINDAGNYDVIISNSAGSVTSVVATLTLAPPQIPPTIGIDSVGKGGDEFVLSFPADALGFTLESAFNLTPPVIWVDLPDVFVIGGMQLTVTNIRSGEGQFFRLKKP